MLSSNFLTNTVSAQVWIKTKGAPKKKKDDWDIVPKKTTTKKIEEDENVKPIGTVQLTASFTMSKREMCPTDSVKLTYRGNGKSYDDVDFNWNFPDSSTFHQAGAGVMYLRIPKPGVYRISIKLTGDVNKYRASKIYTDSIEILPPPNANFSVSKNQICRGEQVDFFYEGNKKTAETYINFQWSFDGGFPLTEAKSLHQTVFWDIPCRGNGLIQRNIKLTTTNQDGCISTVKHKVFVIVPEAKILLSNEHPCNGEQLQVKASTCYNDPSTRCIWNFGSGIDANPSKEGPEQGVTYFNITDYTTSDMIKLQVVQQGCYSNIDSVFLDIYPLILADFTVSHDTIHNGEKVTFNIGDVFTCDGGGEVKYQWKFPDGNILSQNSNKEINVQFNNSYDSDVVYYPSLYIVQDKCKSRPYTIPLYVSQQSIKTGN